MSQEAWVPSSNPIRVHCFLLLGKLPEIVVLLQQYFTETQYYLEPVIGPQCHKVVIIAT